MLYFSSTVILIYKSNPKGMITKELREKLAGIKFFVTDIDGTLTDGAMYYSANGEEMKRFSTRDGMGINLLKKAGIESAIITSENSEIAQKRGEKLKIENIILGCRDKTSALKELAGKIGIDVKQIAYIGDDINDLHVMKICGVSACPADSTHVILQTADYVCKANGGNGAVREFAELILTTQDKPVILNENW
jgi:3-deoxy-D-manno-octulosonate 8-phosphate phosphatase (KDO 8-P phosphatase)